jgi:menaquinone-dependent protoporphyrinogen oxidase
MNVLVTAASKQGATTEIAVAIADVLSKRGLDTVLLEPDRVGDVRGYDAFVIGSAVYAGHWLQPAAQLVDRIGVMLAGRPVWLFSSGPVGDPSRKLVQKMGANPVDLPSLRAQTMAREHRIFAGKLIGQKGGFAQRVSLRVFRGFEGDWRDWDEIERWATTIADELVAGDPSRSLEVQTTSLGEVAT